MFLITNESGVVVPADLRGLIETKIGRNTDTAFGELCGFVERLAGLHSHSAQRAALRPLVRSPHAEITVLEKP